MLRHLIKDYKYKNMSLYNSKHIFYVYIQHESTINMENYKTFRIIYKYSYNLDKKQKMQSIKKLLN